ncbi:hypothetical protein VaNZ11_013448 [Volvox africanus]|uniref:Uncharacterized protein n=1 Tax=Volvox africanus TaxID=51714 RepID=A0ABQ5SHA9_9CHLO|nr:hypothetical protein VaNZ11_013448 [Volvox africanus]
MAKEQLTFGQGAEDRTGKLEDGGKGKGTLEDAAKDATRTMLKRLISAGAPFARSMALAAYGRCKPYNPLAFWRDFDYVRLTLCSADTRQKYQKYDTIMLSIVHFSAPEEIMKAHQTALLLFDVDRDELLGVWKALETVKEGSNTFILWQVVQRLPGMNRKAFHASAAGAIFPNLPPTDTSTSARGEAARRVLRVLSEHATSPSSFVMPSGGLPAAVPPAAAVVPAAGVCLACPLDALCLLPAAGGFNTAATVTSTLLARDVPAAGLTTIEAPVKTAPAMETVEALVASSTGMTAISPSCPSAPVARGAASLAFNAAGPAPPGSPSPSGEASPEPPSDLAACAAPAPATVMLASELIQDDVCLAAAPTANLVIPAIGARVPISPSAAQAERDMGVEFSTALKTSGCNRGVDKASDLPPDQKMSNYDPEANGFSNPVDQPSPVAAAAPPAPEPEVPATAPTIVIGAFDAQDDFENTLANAAVSPVVTDASRDTAIYVAAGTTPAAISTVAGALSPQQPPSSTLSIPVHSVPPSRPAGVVRPPPAYMPPAILMLMQLRTAHAAARPSTGPAPGMAQGALHPPLAAPLPPVAAAPVCVVKAAPAATTADATGSNAPFQITQPSAAQRTSQLVPVIAAAPKPETGAAPTCITPTATPSSRLGCTAVIQAPAQMLGPQPAPPALRPTFLTALRTSQPQISVIPGVAAAQPVAPQVAVRPVPAVVAATAQPLVRPAQGMPSIHSAVAGFAIAPLAGLAAPGTMATANSAASGAPVPTWATGAFPVAPPKLDEAQLHVSADAPAEPPASKAYLLCPLCNQRTGCWFLKVCGHMGPCEECCADPEQVQVMYPTCRCGTAVSTKETLKIRVS